MKKKLLILTLFILLTNLSYSENHFPITRDSESISEGKHTNNIQLSINFLIKKDSNYY